MKACLGCHVTRGSGPVAPTPTKSKTGGKKNSLPSQQEHQRASLLGEMQSPKKYIYVLYMYLLFWCCCYRCPPLCSEPHLVCTFIENRMCVSVSESLTVQRHAKRRSAELKHLEILQKPWSEAPPSPPILNLCPNGTISNPHSWQTKQYGGKTQR